MTEPFRLMALNNAWANATLHRACAALSPEAFAATRPGFFASLKRTLNHIHEVDLFYLDALEEGGKGRAVFDREDLNAPALAEAQAAADMRLAQFCHALTHETLSDTRAVERPGGPVPERVDRILLHLFQHQVHHRGQAHVQLQDAGVAPPQLDEFFLDHGRAPSAAAYMA